MDQLANLSDPTLIQTMVIPWAIKIGVALAIFIIGRWIARLLVNGVERLMKRGKLDEMLAAINYKTLDDLTACLALDGGPGADRLLLVDAEDGVAGAEAAWRAIPPVPPFGFRKIPIRLRGPAPGATCAKGVPAASSLPFSRSMKKIIILSVPRSAT